MSANPTAEESESPLLAPTPAAWAHLAAENLPQFLADHAVCEQQAALTALNLLAHYPDDDALVAAMANLAAEEARHLRRVVSLLHRRGLQPARRRANSFVQGLRARIRSDREPELKVDRLLVCALIEARSSERFTRLSEVLRDRDAEVAALLHDLGPAEMRHWRLFYTLAAREIDSVELDCRWRTWLEWERELSLAGGLAPTVHG